MALPDQELIVLLTDLESDRVERKESAINSDRLSEADTWPTSGIRARSCRRRR